MCHLSLSKEPQDCFENRGRPLWLSVNDAHIVTVTQAKTIQTQSSVNGSTRTTEITHHQERQGQLLTRHSISPGSPDLPSSAVLRYPGHHFILRCFPHCDVRYSFRFASSRRKEPSAGQKCIVIGSSMIGGSDNALRHAGICAPSARSRIGILSNLPACQMVTMPQYWLLVPSQRRAGV